MNIEIHKCVPGDIVPILGLMRDFARYEGLADYCEATEKKIGGAMFGEDAFVEGIAAYSDGTLIGYALFYPHFASFRGQAGYYLEDIFIDDKFRGQGVGEAMLRQIARLAKNRGFERIDFQVLEWNKPAIGFYEKLGAERNDDERHFKFSDEAFETLAA